ncbi:SDR family NAD(P)-dependent oxidoreductase [Paenibacillus sp. sgz500958]|uniref:type I polyketide synthase n=1 Tax=Paenibacillus sp. sgz500958 TaxID=3242475 RepID=UPI0036D2A151
MDFNSIKLDGFSPGTSSEVTFEEDLGYDIAIIGIGLKLPLSENAGEFREQLQKGTDGVRELPASRKKDTDAYFKFKGLDPAHIQYGEAAFIEDIDTFDYSFFKLSPKEASLLDPNQRIFLQTAWRALEDSGYGAHALGGSRTGVYLGYSSESDYRRMIAEIEPESASLAVPGNVRPIIASRLSYILDLKGPSMIVDTTCSSSLVAVHLACQAIRDGECELAVAGGIQLHLIPVREVEVGIESSTSRARTFDDASDGTGSGEGAVAILLKPLVKARADRDSIYAVIKASALGQDGSSVGITAPNAEAQEDVIVEAWKKAGIDPETITYIEAHGTGTKLGDPIEVEGIQRAFRRFTDKKQFCAVGSVKSNLGHLDNAAGITGLLKAVLSLKYKELYPSLHFERPNRKISFEDSPVYVNDRLTEWENEVGPRRCGVSAFGISGTNCHMVLEEAPEHGPAGESASGQPELFMLSSKTRQGLDKLLEQYISHVTRHPELELGDICFTACTGRGHYNHRIALVARDCGELARKLSAKAYYSANEYNEDGFTAVSAHEKLQKAAGWQHNDEGLLEELCRLYVNGVELEWEQLYKRRPRRRVSLPAYIFEEKRCWLNLPEAASYPAEPDSIRLYYQNVWEQDELRDCADTDPEGACLILHDNQGIGEGISKSLRAVGCTVIDVLPGEHYQRINESTFTVTDAPEDIGEFWRNLSGRRISRMVHLASMTFAGNVQTAEELEERLHKGMYHLFRWVQQMVRSRPEDQAEIVIVSAFAGDVSDVQYEVYPENGALFGLGKVIGWEYKSLKVRCIDIDQSADAGTIMRELRSRTGEYMTAYRAGVRYVQRLTKIPNSAMSPAVLLKEGGVYLITGGLGELGLQIARSLAQRANLTLAMLQRSPFPGREQWDGFQREGQDRKIIATIEAIREIEQSGSRVVCCNADVSDQAGLKEVIQNIKNKFGPIAGVIHAAGVMEGDLLGELDEGHFKEIVASKIQGTWLLHHVLKNDPLDFFVLFSSAITLVGGVGSGPYTAGNAYLNSFSAYRSRMGHATLAINWPTWQSGDPGETGGVDVDKELFKVLTAKEGVEIFHYLLSNEVGEAYVGQLNERSSLLQLGNLLPFVLADSLRPKLAPGVNKPSAGAAVAALKLTSPVKLKGKTGSHYSEIEQTIASAWVQVLGYEELDVNDNFFEIGGDSISITKVHSMIEAHYPGKLTVADLFSYSSISKIAGFINDSERNAESVSFISTVGAAAKSTIQPFSQGRQFRAELLSLFGQMRQGELTIDEALALYAAMEVS